MNFPIKASNKSKAFAALSILSASVSMAADLQSISFTGGIPVNFSIVAGEIFYKSQFSFYYDGIGPVVLSANADGTGDATVDDVLVIRVVHPDTTVSVFKHDYSHACSTIIPLAPKDIRKKFAQGLNKVTVIMKDSCGGNVGATSFWLNDL